jgi:hypothetical protein
MRGAASSVRRRPSWRSSSRLSKPDTLRLGYGDPQSPVAAPPEHDMHLNMMISTS